MAYKLSTQWLCNWVKPPINFDQLALRLNMAGIEVASISPTAKGLSGIIIAKVLETKQHPDADRLRVCQVDIGKPELLTIVCGASNVRPGLNVVLAQVGASLPSLPDGIVLKEAKLRGIISQGMICSESELGLINSEEVSNGIMELPNNAPIGMDFCDYLDLNNDFIISIELTPNRGDCLSVLGLAREISALCETDLLSPYTEKIIPPVITDKLDIKLMTGESCPSYTGRLIRNINPQALTPLWLKERLRRSNIRSIHPIVDITNYVMLELGQPMHAFDADKLGQNMQVRYAKEGEKITLLNGTVINLKEKTQVIADEYYIHAIAGVMGGAQACVTPSTQNIFLESAFFSPLSIACATQQYNLASDSSYRFERGVDFNLQKRALERATELIIEIAGGQVGPITDITLAQHLPKISPIILRSERIEKILGFEIANNTIERALKNLGMKVTPLIRPPLSIKAPPSPTRGEGVSFGGGALEILAPSYRFDIKEEIDLIEEIARVIGYENIPRRLPVAPLQASLPGQKKLEAKTITQALIHKGYSEVITYSFINPSLQKILDPLVNPIKLSNPISSEMAVMRSSLWPGLIEAALYNQNRQQARIRLFESGNCFTGIDTQTRKIAGVVYGNTHAEQWCSQKNNAELQFFDVKGDIEALLQLTGRKEQFEFVAAEHPALHPGQTAEIIMHDRVGVLGALHPSLLIKLDIKGPIYLFELDLELLLNRNSPQIKEKELAKFPSIRRDIAITVKQAVPYAMICNKIKKDAGKLLKNVQLFDLYRGKNLPADSLSMAIALTFQAPERTLLDAEVNKHIDTILSGLEAEFSAQVRR